jgi:hypothetical protein
MGKPGGKEVWLALTQAYFALGKGQKHPKQPGFTYRICR